MTGSNTPPLPFQDEDPAHHPAADFISAALARLASGARGRRSDFHVIGIATLGADGAPRLRSVVLRSFEPHGVRLTFHTDSRSAKFAELSRDRRAAILAYDAGAKLQIRIEGQVELHSDDADSAAVWRGLPDGARQIYRGARAPGMRAEPRGLDDTIGEEDAERHFAVCRLAASMIDVLYLRAAGHRRAIGRIDDAGGLAANWVAA